MQIRWSVLLVAAVLLPCTPAAAQFRPPAALAPGEQYHVELGAFAWKPTPGIVLATDGLPGGLNGVDFVQEFGFPTRRFTEFRGVIKGGKHKVRVGKVPVVYAERTNLGRPVVFGGRTFELSADTAVELQADIWRYGYEYDMVTKSAGLFGFIAELKHSRVKVDLTAPDTFGNTVTTSDVTAPIATIGFMGRVYPHRMVGLTMELTGIGVPGFVRKRLPDDIDVDGSFWDFDVSGTVSLSRFLGFQGGYRRMSTNYVVDNGSADLELKGAYFGGIIRF